MRNEKRRSGFYTRGFTTFLLASTFLLSAVTGVVLFVTPRGRVAHWTDWTVLGLGKDEWSAVHMTAAGLLLIAAGVHLFFNWKVILGYLRLKRVAGIRLKRELAASFALSLVLVAGTLQQVPPFGTLLDLHVQIKDSWEPGFDAEEMRFEGFGERNHRPIRQVVRALEDRGTENALPVAEADAVAPSEFRQGSPTPRASGEREWGRGRMTLGELCSAEGLSYDAVAAYLRERGIRAERSSPLREIAASMGMRPGQLVPMLIPGESETFGEPDRFPCRSTTERPQRTR